MKTPAPAAAVDAQNPWLGLVSFTEETRGFFYGRETEVAELGRRVQRKLLTVLFGQSGHGKTSLLRAGLVPRLRPEGFCPVYVRLDYAPASPPPSEQIKDAVLRATAEAGTWTRSGAAAEGESLWEFLHHRDDVLRDAGGRTLVPLLIFDQFEEIFTLAQTDATGRARAQAFLAELADLVENRPPAELEARLENDEGDAARFDFARADYRILITLREDYLPHLEGLKGAMPSVTQNRVRLARMTGTQALEAVLKPGAGLVTADVARSIVLFVSGATDLAHAEVEPPLLSLVSRELNEARLAQGRGEISADLLAGSRDTILSEFYERSLADVPAGVRRFIEDELLTDSGYRESMAEERVKKAFAAAGAPPEALAALVDRRLLRVEERLDVRRVELTHDVLCGVVAASRTARREREMQEAAQAQLAATRAKEAATRRALFRARTVAAVCAVLLLLAAGAAVFATLSRRRAYEAERAARAAEAKTESERLLADTARGQAEGLVSFLLADFFDELEPTGRFDVIAQLAEQTVNYYGGLPAQLRSPLTERRRALALVRQGWAVFSQGKFDAGEKQLNEAVAEFERLRTQGDIDNTTFGLALALIYQAQTNAAFSDPNGPLKPRQRAVELLRTPAAATNATHRTRRTYAYALSLLANLQTDDPAALKLLEEARKVLAGTGALDYSDLSAAGAYASATRSAALRLVALNRPEEADRYRQEALSQTQEVLGRRPGDLQAFYARAQLQFDQAGFEFARYHFDAALKLALSAEQTMSECLRFNPIDAVGWSGETQTRQRIASYLAERGRISEAMEKYLAAADVGVEQRSGAGGIASVPAAFWAIARLEAQRGHREAAEKALAEAVRVRGTMDRERRSPDIVREYVRLYSIRSCERDVKWYLEDYAGVIAGAEEDLKAIARLVQSPDVTASERKLLDSTRANDLQYAAQAHGMLGQFAEAEAILRDLLPELKAGGMQAAKDGTDAWRRAWLAFALVRQDRRAEALKIVEPAVGFYRDRKNKGDDTVSQQLAFGASLYARALAEPDDPEGGAARRASLDEAAQVMASLSDEAKQLHDERVLIARISAELARSGGKAD